MRRRGRKFAIAIAVVAATTTGAGAVIAGTGAGDDQDARGRRARPPTATSSSKIDRLLRQMTVDEKLQQVQLLSDGQITDADAKNGVGGVFSLTDPAKIDHFQHVAVRAVAAAHPDPVRLRHDPRLPDDVPGAAGRGRGVRPGGRRPTTSRSPRASRRRSASSRSTRRWSTSRHEPRWGRIVEGSGEDPYLGSVMAAAKVRAAQGTDYAAPRQGRHVGQAPRRPTAWPRAGATTTRPT